MARPGARRRRSARPRSRPAATAVAALVAAALAGCAPPDGDVAADGSADTARADASAGDAFRRRTDPDTGPAPGDATVGPAACPDTVARASEEEAMEDSSGPRPSIHEVLERRRDAWMETPGVIGTGVGRCDDDPCLVIYLRDPAEELEAELPDCVDGYPVRLERMDAATPPDAAPGGPDPGA